MITIDFTYQTVTPESVEHGDCDSQGFITSGHWKYDVDDYERQQWKPTELGHYIQFAKELGICADEGAGWFYSVDPDVNYQTGEETTYSMHIDGCSEYTKNRIFKLITRQ